MNTKETRIVYTRPVNAHPELPVHAERHHFVRSETGALFPAVRRTNSGDTELRIDWLGSFPTEELARGRCEPRQP